eukprot:267296_1
MSVGDTSRKLLVNTGTDYLDVPKNISRSNSKPNILKKLSTQLSKLKIIQSPIPGSYSGSSSQSEDSISCTCDSYASPITKRETFHLGNFDILQHQWTRVKADWNPTQYIRNADKLKESNRAKSIKFTTGNIAWDTIKNGWCKAPKHNYNPFVRVSLIRASVSTDDDNKSDYIDLRSTLPIYNGGNDVRFKPCDRNTHVFSLKQKEWKTSWLSFEVWDDRILTGHDTRLGDVCMDLSDIQEEGQIYYNQLPIIDKQSANSFTDYGDDEEDDTGEYLRIPTDDNIDTDKPTSNVRLMGVVHVTAIKKVKTVSGEQFNNMQDVFNENKDETFDLVIEIVACTTLKPVLKADAMAMDDRKFKLGIIGFITYLFGYALIMFIAELHTDTGMNEYKESIWFALITVTTLGYGDITAQTVWSKVLNSFFITANVIIVAGFVSNLLGYVVTAGEEALDARLNDTMDGVQHVIEKNQRDIKQKLAQQQTVRRAPSQPVAQTELQTIVVSMHDGSHRTNSMPELPGQIPPLKPVKTLMTQEQKDELRSAAVATTKATKVKLKQLDNITAANTHKFEVQLYVNLGLFTITLLFGFFTLGVAELLEGPNFLTSLPYFGYECTSHDDPYCARDDNPGNVFSDSLYYSIVSITTVGYGDIYPQTGVLARVLGAVFILFGAMMLVRLVDLFLERMLQTNATQTKKRKLNSLLTSPNEFFEFDLDGNGVIDRFEFLVGMLLKLDLVDMDRINEIMVPFHEVDADGNGMIEMTELKSKVYEARMKVEWGEDAWTEIKQSWETINQQQKQIDKQTKRLKKQQKRLKKKTKAFEEEKAKWERQKQVELVQINVEEV